VTSLYSESKEDDCEGDIERSFTLKPTAAQLLWIVDICGSLTAGTLLVADPLLDLRLFDSCWG
jgi:hypothetical protein